MTLISAGSLKSQGYTFEKATATGTWRWTTRMITSGTAPVYAVDEVLSPFGRLRDSVQIPGDVVLAMSESISQLMSQFAPSILVGPPSSLAFEVDEGRGYSDPQPMIITNDGVWGSVLSVAFASSAPYITVSPESLTALAQNENGVVDVSVTSSGLLAEDSPVVGTLTVQDSTATNSPQVIPVTIVVRPRAEITLDVAGLSFSVVKPLSGEYPPIPVKQFTVENSGPSGSVLEYQVQRLTCASNSWLASFNPSSGVLDSGDTSTITVSCVPVSTLGRGTYAETLRVSGYSSNSYCDLTVTLVIT